MKKSLLIFALAAALAACSNTATVTHSWMADNIAQKDLHGVLIVAIAEKPATRQSFETKFADALTARGIHAVASFDHKGGAKIGKEDVLALSRELDLDTVLVTVFAGRDQTEVLHAGRTYYGVQPIYNRTGYYRVGSVYGAPYEIAHIPDFYAQHKSIHLEANLYEIATEEHLWVAAAGMDDDGDFKTMESAFISAFMRQLAEQKLVK